MGLWSTIKSAVSKITSKKDDSKTSSSSKTTTTKSTTTSSSSAPKYNQGIVGTSKTTKSTIAGSAYSTTPAKSVSISGSSTGGKSTAQSTTKGTTTAAKTTSTATTTKITTTGSKGFREIENASKASSSSSSSSSGIQLKSDNTTQWVPLTTFNFDTISSSSSEDNTPDIVPLWAKDSQKYIDIIKKNNTGKDRATQFTLQLPSAFNSTLAKSDIAYVAPGSEYATKPRETYSETNKHSWTKYKVNTAQITDANAINKGLSDGTVEIWTVVKGDTFKSEAKYAEGVTEIGRERLDGLTDKDRVVYYDTKTGKIYKFEQGSADYTAAQRKATTYAGMIETLDNNKSKSVEKYNNYADAASKLEAYTDKLKAKQEKGQSISEKEWDEYEALYSTYSAANEALYGKSNNELKTRDAWEEYKTLQNEASTWASRGVPASGGMKKEDYARYEELKTLFSDSSIGEWYDYVSTRETYVERYMDAKTAMDAESMSLADYAQYMEYQAEIQQWESRGLPESAALSQLSKADKAHYLELKERIDAGATYIPGADWDAQMNEYCDQLDTVKQMYEENQKYFADATSDTQVNSAKDMLVRMVGRALWNQTFDGDIDENGYKRAWYACIWRDFKELGSLSYAPIAYANQEWNTNRALMAQYTEEEAAQVREENAQVRKDSWGKFWNGIVANYTASLYTRQGMAVPNDVAQAINDSRGSFKSMFQGTRTEEVATWTKNMGAVALNNYLINIGETADITNMFIKPMWITGSMLWDESNDTGSYNPAYGKYVAIMNDEILDGAYENHWLAKLDKTLNTVPTTGEYKGSQGYELRDIAGLVALKATWGGYGTTPLFEYDQIMYENGEEMGFWKSLLLTLPLEVVMDPGTWISLGGKAATKSMLAASTDEVLDGVKDVYRAAGFTEDILKSVDDDIAKQVAKAIDDDMLAVLKKAGSLDDTGMNAFKKFFKGDSMDKRLADAMNEVLTSRVTKNAAELADAARLKAITQNIPVNPTKEALFEAVPKTSREAFEHAQALTRSNINKSVADVLEHNKAATGALKLDTSYKIAASIHNAQYRLDKFEDIMRAAAIPQFTVVPGLAGTALKKTKALMGMDKIADNSVADKFSIAAMRVTGKVAGAMEYVHVADDLSRVIKGLEEDFATIDAAVGHTKAHNYRAEVVHALFTDVLNREFEPFHQIMNNSSLSTARKLKILDEKITALTNGKWTSFEEYVRHYDNDINGNGELSKYLSKANIAQIEKVEHAFNELTVMSRYENLDILSNNVKSANSLIAQSVPNMLTAAADMTRTGVLTYDDAVALMLLEDQACTAIDLILNSPANGKFVAEFTGLELELNKFKELLRDVSSAAAFGDVKTTQDCVRELLESDLLDKIDRDANRYLTTLEADKAYQLSRLHKVAPALEPVKVTTSEQMSIDAFGKAFFGALKTIYDVDDAGKMEIIQQTIRNSADAFVKADGTIDADAFTRAYTVQFSHAVEHAIMLGDRDLSQLADEIIDPIKPAGSLVRALYNTAVANGNEAGADAVQAFISAAAEHSSSRAFVEELHKITDAADSTALLDGYASAVSYINSVFKNTDIDNAAARKQAEQSIVDQIVDNAHQFINGTGRQDFHGWEFKCNTLDTDANVRRIQELFADTEYRKMLNLTDTDEFIDVVFSMDTVTKGADPFMISFGIGDEVRTFRNAEIGYGVHQSHAYNMHGVSEADAVAALDAIEYKGVSQRAFRDQIDSYMAELSRRAAEEGKTVRFIGFNNSSAYTDQNRFLKRLNSRNNFGMHIGETVDIGDAVRAKKGIVKISDDSVAAVECAVSKSFTDGKINSAVMGINTGIAYDVHTDMSAIASRMSMSFPTVSNSDKLGLDRIAQRAKQGTETVRIESGVGLGALSDIVIDQKALDEVVRNYCNLGRTQHVNLMAVIRQMSKEDPAILRDYNLYKVIDKTVVESWVDPADLQKLFDDMADGDTVSKLDKVSRVVKAIDSTYGDIAVPELLDDIDQGQGVFRDLYTVVYNEACTRSAQFFDGKQLETLQMIDHMKLNTPQEYFAAITYMRTQYSELFAQSSCARTAMAVDYFCQVNNRSTLFNEYMSDALRLSDPGTADALVFNRGGITDFSRSGITLSNKYTDTLSAANRLHAIERAYANADYVTDFSSYLHTLEAVNAAGDSYTAREIMLRKQFEEVFAPYRTMMQDFNGRIYGIGDHKPTFDMFTEEGYYASANYARNQAAEALKRSTGALETFHQDAVVKTILTMSDEEFETHVVRNCKNALIIDPKASVFQGSPTNMKLLMARIESLQTSKKLIVDTTNADGYIRIYKDITGYSDKQLKELREMYSRRTTEVSSRYIEYQRTVNTELQSLEAEFRKRCETAGVKPHMPYSEQQQIKSEVIARMLKDYKGELDEAFVRSMLESEGFLASQTFTDTLDKMSRHMAADYMVSDLETMTQDTMQLVQESFPKECRLDSAGAFNDWFSESYNCSVIADIDVKKQFNPYASSSIVNNMGNGLHHVRSKMEATTNYLAMFDNETQSIGYMCDEIERRGGGKVRAKDVQSALKADGYTLATCFVDEKGRYTVEKVELTGDKHLAFLRKHKNVICVSNEELLEIQECAKALYKKWFAENATEFNKTLVNMVDFWANTTRNLRVTGYLFGMPFGAALRNKVDATWKAVNNAGIGVLPYIGSARETLSRYEDVLEALYKDGKQLNMKSIQEFFADTTKSSGYLDMDTFMKVYAFNSSSAAGLADTFGIQQKHQKEKLAGMILNNTASEFAGTTDVQLQRYVQCAMDMFQKEYSADMWRVIDSKKYGQEQMVSSVLKRMAKDKELKTLTDKQRTELANMFYHYTPNSTAWANAISNMPVLGYLPFFENKATANKHGLITSNMRAFSNVESDTRLGMALYYMDELGYSANKANMEVIASQFNYNSRSKFVENLDKVFPFSTFKLYNAKYWTQEAIKHSGTMKNAYRISRAQGYVMDEDEESAMIRNMVYRQKLQQGLAQIAEDVVTGRTDEATAAEFIATLNAGIGEAYNEYNGIPSTYARGIPFGTEVQGTRTDPITGKEVTYTYRHILKVGNSFVDALDLLDNCMSFPIEALAMAEGIANGTEYSLPTLFADNVYSPIANLATAYTAFRNSQKEYGTVAAGVEHHIKYATDYDNPYYDDKGNIKYHTVAYEYDEEVGFLEWCIENNYNIIDTIPFVGALGNAMISYHKNRNLNVNQMFLLNVFPTFKEDFVSNSMTMLECLVGTVAPGFVGVEYTKNRTYDTRLASFWTKDAVIYTDWVGKYEKLGFTKEEIMGNEAKGIVGILEYLFGSNDSHTIIPDEQLAGLRIEDNPFTYQNKNGDWAFNIALFDETLLELMARGYTAQEAMQLMCDESDAKWFDPKTGDLLTRSKARDVLYSSEALTLYGQLPDYVKYDKNMYSDLYEYYTQLGYSYKDAYNIIATKHPYFDEKGYVRYYTDEQYAAKTKQMQDDWYAYNAQLESFIKYEPGAATRTAQYVMEKYHLDYDKAYEYIIKNNVYVDYDSDGNPVMHKYTAEQVKKLNDAQAKEFQEYYNQLPTYVKYGKGLYSDTLQYLKSIGFDTDTAKKFIMNGACYLKDQERLIDCTGMSRPKTNYTKYMNDDEFKNYYNSIPEYTRYESGAYKRTYAYLKAQGYNYAKINEMIKNGSYLTEGGVLINVIELGMTGDTRTAYNRTVEYFKNQGMTAIQIREMIQKGYYLNDKGQMLNLIEAGIAKTNSLWRQVEFNDYYATIPEYTRYEKGAYSRTLAYLKKQGYTEDQAKILIQRGAYLDADGNLINVAGRTRSRGYSISYSRGYSRSYNRNYSRRSYGKRGGYYNHSGNTRRYNRYAKPKQKKPIKHYYKQNKVKKPYVTNGSYSSTYSLVNKMNGQNYGMRKIYKVNLGVSPVRKSLSIKSTYPASYRNVVYSNRRSMYREQYAKYGLSRMAMRSGVWHSYSNASTVRLRREAVQYKMRYSGYRARF